MKKINGLVLSTLTAALLVGCGGGSGGTSSTGGATGTTGTNINYGGSVIDGYIQNATVCLDLSLDSICDNSEPSAKTDANGAYSFTVTPEQQAHKNFNIAPVIAYGGTDKDTGADFTGMLQAQVSGTTANVTPLTTVLSKLVQEEVSTNPTISKTDLEKKITEKKDKVKTVFNLSSGTNIEDDFFKSNNLELTKIATEIQKTVDLIVKLGSDSTVDNKVLTNEIFKIIKDKIKDSTTNSDILANTITEVKNPTSTISGFVLDDSSKAKLEIGQNDIKEIVKKITSVADVANYVAVIEDRKKEINEATDATTLVKYTSDDIPTGDALKIKALKNFLEVIGATPNTAKNIAPDLFNTEKVTKSNLIARFTSTTDADKDLQTRYSKLKTLVDAYVQKLVDDAKTKSYAVQAMELLEKTNIETENVDAKITAAKNLVNGLTQSDAVMVQNMLNLTTIFESDTVKNLLDINASDITETSTVGKLVKSTVLDTITLSEKYNGITTNSKTVMHDLATQLKTISDSIGKVFENESYSFAYGNENITYNDSLAIRGAILAVAFKLDFIASYSWGDDADIKTNSEAISSVTYEYQNISVDPATVLNKGNTFKMDSSARLDGARTYLIEGLELANTLPVGYDNSTQEDKNELTAILNSVKGSGTYELVDTEEQFSYDYINHQMDINYRGTWTTTTEKYYVDLSKLLNSTYAIDVTSFGSNFSMACEIEDMSYNSNVSKMHNAAECTYSNFMYDYADGAFIKPATKPTASNSKLDDVVTKIIDSKGNELTGQAVVDFLVADQEPATN